MLESCLCPPGKGIYTVSTFSDRAHAFLSPTQWREQLQRLNELKGVVFLGVPADCGGGILRGANWGPLVLREQLYQSPLSFIDIGDVKVNPHLLHDKYLNEHTLEQCRLAMYGKACDYPVSPLSITEQVLQEFYTVNPELKMFVVGGDHSISYPCVKSYSCTHDMTKTAIIHFDAHTDLLASRLGIDRSFASWAHNILPFLPKATHLIQIGIRASAHDKAYWESTLGVKQFWSEEIHSQGLAAIQQQLQIYCHENQFEQCYISFDIDALDSQEVSTTGTPEAQGLLLDEALAFIETLASQLTVVGADLMEFAPYTQPLATQAGDRQAAYDKVTTLTHTLIKALGT